MVVIFTIAPKNLIPVDLITILKLFCGNIFYKITFDYYFDSILEDFYKITFFS